MKPSRDAVQVWLGVILSEMLETKIEFAHGGRKLLIRDPDDNEHCLDTPAWILGLLEAPR